MPPAVLKKTDRSAIGPMGLAKPHVPPPLPFPPLSPVEVTAPKPWAAIPGLARMRLRHWTVVLSFLCIVLLPGAWAGWYLTQRAADRYVAHLGFVVRAESSVPGASLADGMPALAALTGASTPDAAILEEFLGSTAIVDRVGRQIDLVALWSLPDQDRLFALSPNATFEDVVQFWPRMVRFSTRPGSGLIGLKVAAFQPQHARQIALAIQAESALLVNELSRQAEAEALRSRKEERENAVFRLTSARQAMAQFRATSRLVDPTADIAGEMTVLTDLQRRMADESVTLDMLRNDAEERRTTRNDSVAAARIAQTEKRIAVLRDRIAAEREKFGGLAERDYSKLLAEYESLAVELDFAEKSYLAALAAEEVARTEARRQGRHLAVYDPPLTPQSAVEPRRAILFFSVLAAAMMLWAVLTLAGYGLRDRM